MNKRSFVGLISVVAMCFLVPGNGYSEEGKILKGVFYDVQGLSYKTQTLSGMTNEKGEFEYRPGETVTISVGGLVIGSARGTGRVTPADLVIEVSGDVKKIKNQKVTNMTRLLQSLDKDGNNENGVTLTEGITDVVKKYEDKIKFDQKEETFGEDLNVKALFAELNAKLRTGAQARNHLRRTLYGIKKMTDVKIPTRDGSYLLADIYRPIEEGKYPAILAFGAYGKTFQRGCICSEKDFLTREGMEDRYFEGNPDNYPWENVETINTVDWVPKGYVAVKIDERGVCNTPGTFEQFSLQEAKDYYDAIEWAAKQQWSNGNVGTWGVSYWAMTSFNMAQLQPPSLKAMIPVFGDISSYRDYMFNGGLYNKFNRVIKNSCGEWKGVDWIKMAQANPFDDPALFGPMGELCISPDVNKITVPFWTSVPLEHPGIHIRGSSEAYIHAASKHKKLDIVSGDIRGWPYTKEAIAEYMAFFDNWLKGIKNEVMEQPPVKMMVRTGGGGNYWQYENEWPIARTQYTKYYLDATPSDWIGDGKRRDFMKLSKTPPAKEIAKTYSADVNVSTDPCWSHGVSFVTDPLPEDIVVAGYIKLGTWVSSTSSDMDIVASVRVMDENNKEVRYTLHTEYGYYRPVGLGWLKVSHRKLDPQKSTIYRPYHTHLKADYAPLAAPGDMVEVEVELWPTTGLIKKGHRIRLDIQPDDGCDHPPGHLYEATYHTGASNTIYTGMGHRSYLQIPVIPPKP